MMIYNEVDKDLFSVPEEYYFAQCISADYAMGKGIAKQFNERFQTKRKLCDKHGNGVFFWDNTPLTHRGYCIKVDRVFCLVTKRNYYDKPTLLTIRNALLSMKELTCNFHISQIAIPRIGCGLDRLQWKDVSGIIIDVFRYTNVEILVCTPKERNYYARNSDT